MPDSIGIDGEPLYSWQTVKIQKIINPGGFADTLFDACEAPPGEIPHIEPITQPTIFENIEYLRQAVRRQRVDRYGNTFAQNLVFTMSERAFQAFREAFPTLAALVPAELRDHDDTLES